jgi:hypothetical protein
MTDQEIKVELFRMIEKETDKTILEAIRTILQKTSLDPIVKLKLTQHALTSEQDIKLNRTFSKEDVVQRTNR